MRSEQTPLSGPSALAPQIGCWGNFKKCLRLFARAGIAWDRDNAMRLSAAVSFYTLLSLSALLLITIKVTALVLSEESAIRQVRQQTEGFVGLAGAKAIDGMIINTLKPGAGVIQTILSAALLLFTASGVFNALRDSINTIWGIASKPGRGIRAFIREQFLSVGMVFVIGFLLLVSQVISIALTVVGEAALGKAAWEAVIVELVVSTLVIAALFAVLFRVLPEARVGWRDLIFGSVVTAILFKIGQYLLALYFTYGTTASAYGAAGSFVIVLLWVYYSCWIFFFGAELIKERIHMHGREIEPIPDAG